MEFEMGKYSSDNRWYGRHQGQTDRGAPQMDDAYHDLAPRRSRKLPIAVVVVGFVLWSLLAWLGYSLVDPVLGWLAANAGLLVDSGKDLATAAGASGSSQ